MLSQITDSGTSMYIYPNVTNCIFLSVMAAICIYDMHIIRKILVTIFVFMTTGNEITAFIASHISSFLFKAMLKSLSFFMPCTPYVIRPAYKTAEITLFTIFNLISSTYSHQ